MLTAQNAGRYTLNTIFRGSGKDLIPTSFPTMPKLRVVPEGQKLRRYQQEGVKRIVSQARTLLADAPGCGKTCQAIVASNIWRNPAILIVCPACVTLNWKKEFEAWDIHGRDVFVVGRDKKYSGESVVIVSYESQKKVFPFLKELLATASSTRPSLLIADEFHSCKNWKAQRTDNLINKLLPQFHLFIGITGTPMTNKIPDLHPLVSACAPSLFPGFKTFCETYSHPVFDGYAVEYRGARNITKLKLKLSKFMIRRYKEDVLKDLPDKTYIEHCIEIDRKVAQQSLQYISYVKALLNDENPGELPATEKEALASVRRELGIEKIPGVVDYCKMLLEGGNKPLVIFAYHREVVETLEAELQVAGFRVGKIYGGTSATNKQNLVDKFQSNQLDCLVLSIQAAGVGITLTASSTVVFAELSYVPTEMQQAMDRVHRFGQKNSCMIHFCLAEESLDSKIWQTLLQKVKVINKVVGRQSEKTHAPQIT